MGTRTLDQLRRGARIHTLLHAAYIAKRPERPYDIQWDGLFYRRADAQGVRGTVAFSKLGVVALFYDDRSPRSPRNTPKGAATAYEAHLKGIPEPLRQLAKRELLDDMAIDVGGKTIPAITSAFWNAGEDLVGARPWPRLLEDGASLVETELARPEAALETYAERYGFDAAQIDVVRRLLLGKEKPAANARVVLSSADRATLGLLMNQTTRDLLQGAGIALE